MRNISNIVLAFIVVVAGLTGCIRETFPQGKYVTSGQIEDSPFALEGTMASMPAKMLTNVVGVDDDFDFGYPGIMGATDRMVGEVFPVAGNLEGGNPYYDRWSPWHYTEYDGLSATGWATPFFYINYYKFIKAANDVLLNVGDSDAGKEVRGVAKAFRALYYLDLARLYDALPAKAPMRPSYESERKRVQELTVPLVEESTDLVNLRDNPRLYRDDMFEFIFRDLDDAEKCLGEFVRSSKSLPDLAVVYGLKARAYLWLGGIDKKYPRLKTGVAAYRMAAEYARKAIDASGCTIMDETAYLDPFSGFNKANSAWMWGLLQSTGLVLGNIRTWTAHMSPEAVYGYGYVAQPGISSMTYDRMSEKDFRRKMFVGPDRSFKKMDPYTSLTEAEFETIAPYASFKFHTAGGEKRNFTTANVTDIPLMRVEEMYFIEAEAVAHYDEGTAKNLIEEFMKHRAAGYKVPGAACSGDDLIDEIIFQKRVEFWGEGIIWADFKRLDMSILNGYPESNAPADMRFITEGRAPWWNCVFPQSAASQNTALLDMNNPDPTGTYASQD